MDTIFSDLKVIDAATEHFANRQARARAVDPSEAALSIHEDDEVGGGFRHQLPDPIGPSSAGLVQMIGLT